jgi:hypothetical protein
MKWIWAGTDVYTCVDDEDYDRVKNITWKCYKAGYVKAKVEEGSPRYLHQVILGRVERPLLIDHINRNKLDNRKCNLRIVDYKESNKNRGICSVKLSPTGHEKALARRHWEYVKHNRHLFYPRWSRKLRKVINIDTGEVFHGAFEAARKYNMQQSLITACCNGRRKAHWGYHWEYYDEEKHAFLLLL